MKKPGVIVGEVYRNLFRKRATILYPFKEKDKVHLPDGYRGRIEFYRDKCIGCQICSRVCPVKAINIIEDERGKRPVFMIYRCIYCEQCAESCPTKAIKLTKVFENIAFEKEKLFVR